MSPPDPGDPSPRLEAAADRLRVDAATSEALEAFEAAGVEALVLKGPSLTGWLYGPDDAVAYVDSDLLIRPGDEAIAGKALAGLRFETQMDDSRLPEWWREHDVSWLRAQDGVRLELHRRLVGIGVDPETAWAVFAGSPETIPLAGKRAPALAPPARLLHIALHAAQHGEAWGKATAHVERAVERFDDSLWREAVGLAEQLDALDSFAAGLRLVPQGAVLADRLSLPTPSSPEVALRATTPPPVALGLEQLAQARTDALARCDRLAQAVSPARVHRSLAPARGGEPGETRAGLSAPALLAAATRPAGLSRLATGPTESA